MKIHNQFPDHLIGQFLRLLNYYGRFRTYLADITIEEKEEWYLVAFHDVRSIRVGLGFNITEDSISKMDDGALVVKADEVEIVCGSISLFEEEDGDKYFDTLEDEEMEYANQRTRVTIDSI